ncbi:hypothetical protein VitviT2T_007987 [Vitis vinifera]|uniref:Uncharacterized protein n=2 Tax=Vitis vinifera TaxID=29760 RepID=F6GTZ3_VITVI|nr:uncharacterized protein LOC100246731 isoform X1 [Vitis vinifera]RVW38832.1 hypothetical protein CK203_074223 [Vitis vinifera]WJZ88712.1 hypothetical protein VitviT2T_007987 [Vitis vinifera]|eukprot:XP_002282208.1 PREDICTED: uncharacterized protein LOC100246731 isoform X1 [Vitis vinifera]
MDLHSTQFAGKVQSLKSRTAGKNVREEKNNSKDPPIAREKRAFGTSRSTNIPAKTETEKPAIKPTTGATQKQSKSSRATAEEKKLPEKNKARLKKNSVCFQEKVAESPAKQHADGPRTPAAKPKVSTPYHTAENCSKCRFDRLETATYWLAQIKLSESVGKHFVSAAFFRLALECKAEPIRNIRNELKRYLGRHGHLLGSNEWKDVNESYGLIENESSNVEQLHQELKHQLEEGKKSEE